MSRTARGLAVAAFGVGVLGLGLWAWGIRVPPAHVPELTATVRRDSIEVGARQRSFLSYIPATVQPDPSLMLVLHASSMSGARMREITGYGFDAISDREGLIVVYPDGYGGNWNDCRAVGDYEAKRLGIDDVAFLGALVDRFVNEHGVLRDRVFAAGFSNGGQMAYRLALEAPDLVRAVAAIAASLPAAGNLICTPAGQAVPTIVINGTDDPLNPYGGGEVSLFNMFFRRGTVESTMATARYWSELAGIRDDPSRERLPDVDPGDGTMAQRWTWDAGAGPDIVHVAVEGGGHTIPHPDVTFSRVFGRTSHDFSAADEIWRFFHAARDLRQHQPEAVRQ